RRRLRGQRAFRLTSALATYPFSHLGGPRAIEAGGVRLHAGTALRWRSRRHGSGVPWSCSLTWIAVALASTALFGLVNVLDKKLVMSYFPSTTLFNLSFGLLQLVIAAVFLVSLWIFPEDLDTAGIPWAIATGAVWPLGLFPFFHGPGLAERSRATPIQMTS